MRGCLSGLKVSPNNRYLALCSHAAELQIYCLRQKKILHKIEDSERDSFKGMDWCPWLPNLLATGSLGKDGAVKVWNIDNGTQVSCVSTGLPVRGVNWVPNTLEL